MRLASRGFLAVSPMFQPRYAARRRAARTPQIALRYPSRHRRDLRGCGAEYCEIVTQQHEAGSTRAVRADTTAGYPGERLGLPEGGRGSVSGMARRVGALFIDWLLSTCIVVVAIRPPHSQVEFWTLVVFAAQDVFLTALTGLTVGKLVLRIRAARLDGRLIGGWALVRTLLLLTVIPALVLDKDLRGLHDRAANTVVVRI